MPGSGKSAVVRHLAKKGWRVVHFGAITMDEIKKRGLAVNEENERKIREELRKTQGMEAYARLSITRIKDSLSAGPTIIDGLYSWSEYRFLRQQFRSQMYVLAISAPRHARYERLLHRCFRPLSYEEAESRDFAEIENLEKGGPIAIADYTVTNNGSKRELFSVLDRLMNDLFSEKRAHIGKREP
jgi:dephospho-CoA kinase